MSLRTRVLAGSLLIGILLSFAAFVVVQSTSASLLAQVDQQLRDARSPLDSVQVLPDPSADGVIDDPAGGLRLSALYVWLCYPDGTVLGLATPDIHYGEAPDIDVSQAWQAAQTRAPYTLDGGVDRYRVLAYPQPGNDTIVVLALPLRAVDATVARVSLVALATTLVILAVLALVAWWVIRLGIRPIKQMTATASAIAAGDLSHRVPEAASKTEAGDLGRSLNSMLSSIETAFD
nr:HAMP domain-containing protein [Geodermatophilaceae bacterium]